MKLNRISAPERGGNTPLDVHARLTLHGDGRVCRHATVHCPLRECSLDLDECAKCGHCSGLSFDSSHQQSYVMCAAAPEQGLEVSVVPAPCRVSVRAGATEMPITAIMTRDVVCVSPDVSVESLTSLFLSRDFSGAPVVDDTGKPVGVVSKTDILRSEQDQGDTGESEWPRGGGAERVEAALKSGFHLHRLARETVADIMTPIAFALPENASIAQAAALMAYEGVHRIPVVSNSGSVVGLVSSIDVLRWIGQANGYLVPACTKGQRA
jgi:CBS domain-containing protein